MLKHLKTVDADWEIIGLVLGVPTNEIQGIKASNPNGGVSQWMIRMIQYWLDTTPDACWEQVVTALEQADKLTLASTIKQQYLWPLLTAKDPNASTSSPPALPSTSSVAQLPCESAHS